MSAGANSNPTSNSEVQKIAFEIEDRVFRFAINPNNISDSRPHRSKVVKTGARINVQTFGDNIRSITLKGTTGHRNGEGARKIKEMKEYLYDYANGVNQGGLGQESFIYHNYMNGESLVVHLSEEGVSFEQDASNPLLHNYTINLLVLGRAGEDVEITQPEIGNGDASMGNDELTGADSQYTESETTNPQDEQSNSIQTGSDGISYQIGAGGRRF